MSDARCLLSKAGTSTVPFLLTAARLPSPACPALQLDGKRYASYSARFEGRIVQQMVSACILKCSSVLGGRSS